MKWLPFTVFGVLSLLCALLAMFLPETLNKALPDSLPPKAYRCCWSSKENTATDEEAMPNNVIVEELEKNHCQVELKEMLTTC